MNPATKLFFTRILCALVTCLSVSSVASEDFSFDPTRFEKKPYELRGYIEIEPTYLHGNQDGALYQLEFFNQSPRDEIARLPVDLELEGRYRRDITTLSFRSHSTKVWDYRHEKAEHLLYEGLLSLQPNPGFTLDLGKKAYLWGKGYAWNPVAFVERPKDASNPDLGREGFWTAGFDWIKSYNGPLQTIAFTPLILPNHGDFNTDFGQSGHNNFAAKLYLLYRNVDIDLMVLSKGSLSARYGVDFAKNISPNFEIHGELAYIEDAPRRTISPSCTRGPTRTEDVLSYLLGLRYRTDYDATFIFEYYFNGAGNREQDQRRFYECVHQAWDAGDDSLLADLALDGALDKGPFTKKNPMRRYLNLRMWWNEPLGTLYFVPALQVLYNLEDQSFSLSPEFNYSGIDNLDVRLRASLSVGDPLTEWGEKLNDYKLELRLRYYF